MTGYEATYSVLHVHVHNQSPICSLHTYIMFSLLHIEARWREGGEVAAAFGLCHMGGGEGAGGLVEAVNGSTPQEGLAEGV